MRFTGFDAYKQLLAVPEINYVILATPPHFRPVHLKAAIEAGKHVFMEKPVAVDVPGVKMVMEAGELAKQKGLGIAAGTQRRHQKSYQETIKRIHDGAIGEIVYARCYWNGGEIWVVERQPGWSDMEWQLRNWNYFTWLSGDHFVEQHVHNLDVMNWVLGRIRSGPCRAWADARSAPASSTATSSTISPSSSSIPTACGCSASAGRSTAATTWSRRPWWARRASSNCSNLDPAEEGQALGGSGRRAESLSPGARGPDRQHPRRQAPSTRPRPWPKAR